MQKQYPILIIDPHGDNLGIVQKAKKLFPKHKIKLFIQKYLHQKIIERL